MKPVTWMLGLTVIGALPALAQDAVTGTYRERMPPPPGTRFAAMGRVPGNQMKDADRCHKWVEWSDEDQVDIGNGPDLITGIHGDDPVAHCAEPCEVVAAVLDHFHAQGIPLPQPRVRLMWDLA